MQVVSRVEAGMHIVRKLGTVPGVIGEFSRMIGRTKKNLSRGRRMIGRTLLDMGLF